MHAWKPERFGFKGLVQASGGVYRVPSGLVLLPPAQVNGPSPTRTLAPRLSGLRIFSDLCLFFYFFNFF